MRGSWQNHQCPHCRHRYASTVAAATCCLFAPKQAVGWCSWCGRDCPGTFCSRPCAVAYQNDVLASREALPVRGWCNWCGRDCRGAFCNPTCKLAYRNDRTVAA